MLYLILLPIFFIVMLIYFRIADHYNIIDHPNERSSHKHVTIRGGGVIYVFAAMVACYLQPSYWAPFTGIFLVGIISFLDDRHTLSSKLRLFFHLLAATLFFYYLNVFSIWSWGGCLALYILVIGIINAYNFMDGINGITGLYSLVVLLGLQYVNLYEHAYIDANLIWLPILASLVFLYFNFRKRARCFAGDVGSVTIAFWIVFLLFDLIFKTGNWAYILFLAVYGVDSVFTIIHRILLKQNIFEAHRLHFYQLLANEKKVPHLMVATGYAIVQLLIIAIVCLGFVTNTIVVFLITLMPLVVIYLWYKPRLMKLRTSVSNGGNY